MTNRKAFISHWLSPHSSFWKPEQNIVPQFSPSCFNLQNPNRLQESHSASLVQVWPSLVSELAPLKLCIFCVPQPALGMAHCVYFLLPNTDISCCLDFHFNLLVCVDTKRTNHHHDNLSLSFPNFFTKPVFNFPFLTPTMQHWSTECAHFSSSGDL